MSRSRAAVFDGEAGRIALRDFATPAPQRGEVLVKVRGCTLCGSDLHTFQGRRTVPVPTVLGHEIVGEIVAFGDAAPQRDLAGAALHTGDRVVWAIVASCGECFYCRRDLPQKCARRVKYGHEALQPGRELLGGLAEHCLLTAGTALVRLPAELPLAVACPSSCATATVAAAIAAAGEPRDRCLVIYGAGLLGLTACAMLRTFGAATVICVDVDASRRQRALQFGATHAAAPEDITELVRAATQGHGADAVLELSGAPAAFESAWPLLRLGGTLVLVGAVFPGPPVAVSLDTVVCRNLTIRGVHNYTPADLMSAVAFLSNHHAQFSFADLVTAWHPLQEIAAAFAAADDRRHIRIGVVP
jgi:alcohol dehydrogenase